MGVTGINPGSLTWISAPNGQRWQVAATAAPALQGFLTDLYGQGYRPLSSGGYSDRWVNILGRPQVGRPSNHAYGTAIDIGAGANAQGGTRTNLPANTRQLAQKWGLRWGMDFKVPDPMHFEVAGGAAAAADPVSAALATIRKVESGGDYHAKNKYSSASGAYQFTDGTWRAAAGEHLAKVYPSAWMAPKEVQDRVASTHLQGILARNGGDISLTPISWYTGKTGKTARALAGSGVTPAGGGNIPISQYQTKWLKEYQRQLGQPGGTSLPTAVTPGGQARQQVDERAARIFLALGQVLTRM